MNVGSTFPTKVSRHSVMLGNLSTNKVRVTSPHQRSISSPCTNLGQTAPTRERRITSLHRLRLCRFTYSHVCGRTLRCRIPSDIADLSLHTGTELPPRKYVSDSLPKHKCRTYFRNTSVGQPYQTRVSDSRPRHKCRTAFLNTSG